MLGCYFKAMDEEEGTVTAIDLVSLETAASQFGLAVECSARFGLILVSI